MSNSAQLERQADSTRRQLARTLEELRERITPGHLMDQVVDYAKDSGGGDFVRNLGRQVADNPLPVSLIGAGIAWLMLAKGGAGRTGDRAAAAADQVSGAATTAYDATRDSAAAAGDAASRVSDTVGAGYDAAKESAASTYRATRDGAAAMGGAISDTVSAGYESAAQAGANVSRTASSLGQQTADLTQSFLRFCSEQPLVLAGIGLAIGAAAGAALPATKMENELMGEASDAAKERVKQRAKGVAQDQYEKGKEIVESAAQRAQEAAQEALDQSPATDAPAHAEAKLVPDAGEETPAQTQPGEQRRGFVE